MSKYCDIESQNLKTDVLTVSSFKKIVNLTWSTESHFLFTAVYLWLCLFYFSNPNTFIFWPRRASVQRSEPRARIWGGGSVRSGLLSSVLYLIRFLRWFPWRRRRGGFLTGARNRSRLRIFTCLSSDRRLFTSDGLCGSWLLRVDPAIRQRRSELNSEEEKRNSDF